MVAEGLIPRPPPFMKLGCYKITEQYPDVVTLLVTFCMRLALTTSGLKATL